jgi:hypothetical protein
MFSSVFVLSSSQSKKDRIVLPKERIIVIPNVPFPFFEYYVSFSDHCSKNLLNKTSKGKKVFAFGPSFAAIDCFHHYRDHRL